MTRIDRDKNPRAELGRMLGAAFIMISSADAGHELIPRMAALGEISISIDRHSASERESLPAVASCWGGPPSPRLQRVKGIEPSCVAWEATVLPLNYTRGWRK